jgi:hypothetical protein
MPQETTTATKNPWVILSAQTSRHSNGGKVAVEPCSTDRLTTPVDFCIVHPPAFPGLALAIPVDVAHQIDALTRSALVGASLADLPTFEELATERTFGPDAGRLVVNTGLSRSLAASVARWGSALYHLGTRLNDARTAAQWASDATRRAVERRDEVDAADLIFIRRRAGQWGGGGLCANWRNYVADRPDIAPPERDAKAAHTRLVAYQVEGRLRHLLSTGGLPCRMAVALAATFDGAGWSEMSCMLAGEMTGAAMTAIAPGAFTAGPKLRRKTSGMAKRETTERARLENWIASVAHDAVRWAEQAWRTAEAAPAAVLLPEF